MIIEPKRFIAPHLLSVISSPKLHCIFANNSVFFHLDNDVVVYYNGNMLSLNALARSLNKTVTYSDLPFCSASCKGRCGKQERLLVNSCFCDLDCKHYGDCCFDIELR